MVAELFLRQHGLIVQLLRGIRLLVGRSTPARIPSMQRSACSHGARVSIGVERRHGRLREASGFVAVAVDFALSASTSLLRQL